ncbi:MAG TPA: hypothetical protein VJV23_08710, partial [Candidatus Polarisedimenticolia bacterium]|nr:hypothetical protein [Candidatus Polarisedimenticolia bacterium]
AGLAVSVTWLGASDAAAMGRAVFHGPAYSQEMREWIALGEGRESEPSRFIPQHLLHAAAFCLLSAATAGGGGLVLGAAMLSYMSFYAGDFAARAQACPAVCAALLAWNPWSIVRVASFIVLGVVLAEPLAARGSLRARPAGSPRAWVWAALAGLAADIVLKSALAPAWRTMLASCLG